MARRLNRQERVHSLFLCVLLGAVLLMLGSFVMVTFLPIDLRLGAVVVGIIAAPTVLFVGTWLVCRTVWRCGSCGQRLPTLWRRGITSPVPVHVCPSCSATMSAQ